MTRNKQKNRLQVGPNAVASSPPCFSNHFRITATYNPRLIAYVGAVVQALPAGGNESHWQTPEAAAAAAVRCSNFQPNGQHQVVPV